MGKVYKDKKSSGCALCKPHKHGWEPKKKRREIVEEIEAEKEVKNFSGQCDTLQKGHEAEIQGYSFVSSHTGRKKPKRASKTQGD